MFMATLLTIVAVCYAGMIYEAKEEGHFGPRKTETKYFHAYGWHKEDYPRK
jgi:hypothetical protein